MTPIEALDDLMPHIQGDALIPIVIWPYQHGATGAQDAETPAQFEDKH